MELDVVACNTALTLCDAQWQRALEILHQTQALGQGGMKKVKQRSLENIRSKSNMSQKISKIYFLFLKEHTVPYFFYSFPSFHTT